ncbi:MAG: 3-deoxy-D-manno-octulosonic acid transferase [Planctomycetota bacterium]
MTTSRSRLRVALAHGVYNAFVGLACLLAAPPWLVRSWRDKRHSLGAGERFGRLPSGAPGGAPIWIHAVSVGEVKAARPLVRALLARDAEVPIVLSTLTPAGYETARRAFPDLYVFHAPLDLGPVVRRVMRRLAPRLLVLIELEVWPSLLRVADEQGVPLAIVNGRITESSWRGYRRWRWWLPEFDRLDLVAAQDETYKQRLVGLGVPAERVHVTGNLKHELAAPPAEDEVRALGGALGLDGGRAVFLAGSTHEGEEELVLDAWLAAGGGAEADLVLVPRHVHRVPEVKRLLDARGIPYVLRTVASNDREPGTVLLVDTMGELEALFGLARVVFLGGSLAPVGGHNLLEPAAAGCALVVGPHLDSCRAEADLLLGAEGLVIVEDGAGLGRVLGELLGDEARRQALGTGARRAAASLRGAADADVALLAEAGLLAAPTLDVRKG